MQDIDKKIKLYQPKSNKYVTKDQIKSIFITENVTIKELANRFNIPERNLIEYANKENWVAIKNETIEKGLEQIQSTQIQQADNILKIENALKALQIKQLEDQLGYLIAYNARYNHLFKVHPTTGELLLDHDSMPIPIKIPNIVGKIKDLKESITLSDGIKALLTKIELINPQISDSDDTIINIDDYTELFENKED